MKTLPFTSDVSKYDDSDTSDFKELDLSPHACGEITESVEDIVEAYSENCIPLETISGNINSGIIKELISNPKEEIQCVGIKLFGELIPGEDRSLISNYALVCH